MRSIQFSRLPAALSTGPRGHPLRFVREGVRPSRLRASPSRLTALLPPREVRTWALRTPLGGHCPAAATVRVPRSGALVLRARRRASYLAGASPMLPHFLTFVLTFSFFFLSYKRKARDCGPSASVLEGGNRTRTCCTCYGAPSALPLSYLPMHGKRRRKVQCAPFGRFPSSLRVPSPSAVRMPTDNDFRHPPSPLCAARSQRPVLGTRVWETTG